MSTRDASGKRPPFGHVNSNEPKKIKLDKSLVTERNKENVDNQNNNNVPVSSVQIDVNEIMRLIKDGLIGCNNKPAANGKPSTGKPPASQAKKTRRHHSLWEREKLRSDASAHVNPLYIGDQCGDCGERFKTKEDYRQHLDWHFLNNRRNKEIIKRGTASRGWYCDANFWIKQDHVESKEECVFEKEKQLKSANKRAQPAVVHSVKDMGNKECCVCSDPFELFYHIEEDEWHLMPAICIKGLNMHPDCHGDYLKNGGYM